MREYIEEPTEFGFAERHSGGWRVIASAWAIAMALFVFFAGVEAMASRHVTPVQHQTLAGVVIPRHDPSCGDVTVAATPNCRAGKSFAHAEADAEAEAAYGW